jgi:DNA helicase-2/ATP-dependent DNA helicase PcrA
MEIIDGLDPHQHAAATSKSLKSKIIAGAGTGKTRTLTARIAWLLSESRIPAEKIFAVTFTVRASRELKERIEGNVGIISHGLALGTFHSLAAKILRRHAVECGLRSSNFGIVDEDEARQIMAEAATDPRAYGAFVPPEGADEKTVKELHKDWLSGSHAFASKALRQIALWKAWGLTEAMVSDPGREARDEKTERYASAYGLYQHELERRNLVDFGDLILKVVELFRGNDFIRQLEADRVEHLLVDEAQDANPVQIELVHFLSSVHGGLTIVGDEDQSIYGFQGGYVGAMADMAGSDAVSYSLITNRRCTDQILTPANIIVGYNRRKTPKVLVSGRSGAKVFATGHVTDLNEAAWVAQEIGKLVAIGVDPGEVAILFRSNFAVPPFEEALARVGVASAIMSGSSMLVREEVKDVLAFLKLAINPYDDLSFLRIANKPTRGLGSTAVEGITAYAKSKNLSFLEACEIMSETKIDLGLTKSARAGVNQLAQALAMIEEEGRHGRAPFDVVTTALQQTKYLDWVNKQEDAVDRLANVDAIHRLAEGFSDVGEFLQQVSLLTDGDPAAGTLGGKVRLMTIHASKGLEFDHVYCVGFDEGVMPNARAIEEYQMVKPGDPWNGPQGGGLEEERRLCHVAFTRARHTLNVTFPHRRSNRKGKVRQAGPSFFLEECDLSFKDMEQMLAADLGKKNGRKGKNQTSGYERS